MIGLHCTESYTANTYLALHTYMYDAYVLGALDFVELLVRPFGCALAECTGIWPFDGLRMRGSAQDTK